MGAMVAGQFRTGFQDQTTNIAQAAAPAAAEAQDVVSEEQRPDNLIALGARFGRFTAAGKASNVITVPLGYSFRFREKAAGLRSLDISLPVTYAEIEGGRSAAISFDAGLTYGVNERWSLSPRLGAGVVGSIDLGAGGGIGSVSVTSAYAIPLDGWSLNIGNMIGHYETLDISIGDYNFNPGVSNTVLRNGLMASWSIAMGERELVTELWVTDTRYFGSDLYSTYYNEFGASIGLPKNRGGSIESHLRGGVSYLTGDGVEGWRLNIGYWF